ncbi:MAG: sodium-dependent transporter [Clostridiales bacterium]|nr:MAG: sodium-dependent transporter [Clostridiales bacterium]
MEYGEHMGKKREEWTGTFGFIMASAGSAVGLGNLWKFPYLAGMYGGGLFVIVYLVMVFIVGFTLILGELAVGRYAKSNAVSAFQKINSKFAFVGYLGVISSFVILSFYSVVGGWILKYIFSFLTSTDFSDSEAIFGNFISSAASPVIWHILFLTICIIIVLGGVSKGIERASVFMMPALLVMIIFVAVQGILLDGAHKGLEFYLKPNTETFSFKAVAVALGQVFFSLSLGMGTLITYGSYLSKKEKLVKSSMLIAGLDTLIALLAGFAILPAVFALGMKPDSGPSLMFITLPKVFMQMPGGIWVGTIFFILLIFAAITSVISLLEVIITYFVEKHNLKRRTAAFITALILYITGSVTSLSQGPLEGFKILGKNIFDFLDMLASNFLLPLGGLFLCIVIGFIWKPKNAIKEITNENSIKFRLKSLWVVLIKYVMPVCIVFIILDTLGIFS